MRLQNPCCIEIIDAFTDGFWIIPDLRCQKRLLILCFSATSITIWRSDPFFTFSPLYFREPLRKRKAVVCDLWLVDIDPFCVFLCFKVILDALFLKSTVSFTLALRIFFIFFTLKHGKFRFQRWNCSYRASKSRGNTATEGWKRTGTFPLTFTFADKHSGCYGNGLIDVAEKFEFGACSIWIVEDVGRSSFLFPTNLRRSKETLFTGYSEPVSSTKLTGPLSLFSFPWSRHSRIKIPRISAVSSSRKLNDIYFLFTTLLKLIASFGTCKLHDWKDGRP